MTATRPRSRSRAPKSTSTAHPHRSASIDHTEIISQWSPIDLKFLLTLMIFQRLKQCQCVGEFYIICMLVTIDFMCKHRLWITKNICITGRLGYECIEKHAWSSLYHAKTMLKSFCEMSKSLTIFSSISIICAGIIASLICTIYHFL